MSEEFDQETPEEEVLQTEAEAEPESDETEEQAEQTPAPEGPERLSELEAECADLKDKLMRAMAETENVRRRAQRDKEDASKYAIVSFAREMVSVADNLGRALESVDEETRKSNEAINNLFDGVEMTMRELLNNFERAGIKRIDAMGQLFDHNLHEAMFEMEDAEKPSGTVVQVVQVGYTIQDRLLRPAKVGVSKGGPRAEAGTPGPEAEEQAQGDDSKQDGARAYEKDAGPAGANLDEEL